MIKSSFFIHFNDFELEIIKSEYSRTRIMILALLIILAVSFVNSFFLNEVLTSFFGSAEAYYIVVGWMLLLTLFETLVLIRIRWFHTRKLRLPYAFKLIYSLIEISLPSALMFYMIAVKGVYRIFRFSLDHDLLFNHLSLYVTP